MVLVGGNEDNAIFSYLSFSLLTYHYPPTGKNKYLVLPGVLVRWGEGTWLNIKDTHTEVWCPLIGTDNLTLNYPGHLLDRFSIKITAYYHCVNLLKFNYCPYYSIIIQQ